MPDGSHDEAQEVPKSIDMDKFVELAKKSKDVVRSPSELPLELLERKQERKKDWGQSSSEKLVASSQ